MRRLKTAALLALAAAALAALACDESEDGEGTLGVEIWGEEYIEDGIPAAELADGWAVEYERFLIVVGGIAVAEEGSDPALSAPGYLVWDLAATSGPQVIATATAPEGAYDHSAYTVGPAGADAAAGNATADDVQTVVDGGFSVYVEGEATDGADTVSFAWGFETETVYDPCHSTAVLEDGGAVNVQITIHGDHLFYDDATSESPDLRFEDIALADANDDGEVTQAELEAYDITALPNYGVGSLDISDMWGYLEHMTTTLGHIDGEGHCGG